MGSTTARRPYRRLRRRLAESLEPRWLLAGEAISSIEAHTNLVVRAAATSGATGMSPAEIRNAYAFNQIQFNGVSGDGSGQTIAIVDAYDDPNIASDLAVFDQTYGIAAPPSFEKVYASGSRPATDAGWSGEIALDVEWAHAIAPGANIVLVEANSANLGDLLAGVNVARKMPAVSVISMSWGGSEFSGEASYDQDLTTPAGHQPMTFVAAAGDQGGSTIWPAVSPNVLTVGGTSLYLVGGNYSTEAAWSGGGGGVSSFENEPAYQNAVQSSGQRDVPDVAYDADPSTGFTVYDSVSSRTTPSGWIVVGGTSAGAPQWAALIAIADQGRALAGEASLGNAQASLYQVPSSDFHDVTAGSNGNPATVGYDLATGLGSPIANLVVASLVGGSSTGGSSGGSTGGSSGGSTGGSSGGSTGGSSGGSTGGSSGGTTGGSGGSGDSGGSNGSGGSNPGLPVGLGGITLSLVHSYEYDSDVVTRAYATLLGRVPDAQGLAWWAREMQLGATDEEIDAALLGSAEYFDSQGASDENWVSAIYEALLQRTPDPMGLNYWVEQLQAGLSREEIALQIATSAEHDAIVVGNDFSNYLQRSASAADIAYWVAQMQQGTTDEDIVASFIASPEYYDGPQKGNGSPQTWLDAAFEDLYQRQPTANEVVYWLSLL